MKAIEFSSDPKLVELRNSDPAKFKLLMSIREKMAKARVEFREAIRLTEESNDDPQLHG